MHLVRARVEIRNRIAVPAPGNFAKRFAVNAKSLVNAMEAKPVAEQPTVPMRNVRLDLRERFVRLAAPDPVSDSSTAAYGLLQVPRSRPQQSDDLDEVRLAGTVRPDQHIKRLELQRLSIGTDGQHVLQLDAVHEHGVSPSTGYERAFAVISPLRVLHRSALVNIGSGLN